MTVPLGFGYDEGLGEMRQLFIQYTFNNNYTIQSLNFTVLLVNTFFRKLH